MKIMKSIKVKLEKDVKTPFNYVLNANSTYHAEIDGNGTVHISANDGDLVLLTIHFVKGTNVIIL